MKYLHLIALCLFFAACGSKNKGTSYETFGESGLTTRTENLKTNLLPFEEKGVIIGQMYGTTEGIGWMGDSARSDFQSVAGVLPACVGYELCGIERGLTLNSDSISFQQMRTDIIDFFRHQGLIVLRWTAPNPGADVLESSSEANNKWRKWVAKLSAYMNSLQNGYGVHVPLLLAICPLDGSAWYENLSIADYKKLQELTISLVDEATDNVIYAFSNSAIDDNMENFTAKMPDAADVVEFFYLADDDAKTYKENLSRVAHSLSIWCSSNMKAAGVITGLKGLTSESNFWSNTIQPVVDQCRLSYLMLGGNHGDFKAGNFYAPYPGHHSVPDFIKLRNDSRAIFMNRLNGLLVKQKDK